MTSEPYPSTAFVLSLIAGIFILLGGILTGLIGAAITFFAFGVGAVIGVFGIVWGILVIVGASKLRTNPEQHSTWGAIILVFSIISWFGAFGGFAIGFILGLVGGILALVWSPPRPAQTYTYATPPPMSSPNATPARYCPHCGRSIPPDAVVCPYCGNKLS